MRPLPLGCVIDIPRPQRDRSVRTTCRQHAHMRILSLVERERDDCLFRRATSDIKHRDMVCIDRMQVELLARARRNVALDKYRLVASNPCLNSS